MIYFNLPIEFTGDIDHFDSLECQKRRNLDPTDDAANANDLDAALKVIRLYERGEITAINRY